MRLKLIVFTFIAFLLLCYFTNHNFNIFIKSKLSSQHTHNVNKCKEFFNSILMNMKHNTKIKNYYYDNAKNTFIIEVEGESNLQINLIGDSDNRRYGISDPKY